MSECVVRMEMPENCYVCEMRGAWAFCPIGKWPIVGYKKQRHEDCPIIAVLPEKHGRLVDMKDIDSMMEDIQTTSDENGLYGLYYRDDFDFDGLPTIVPATEGVNHETD